MVDMAAVSGLAASLQLAAEITKGIIGLRDATVIQDKVIELQRVILSAQSSALAAQSHQFTLLERVRTLEKQVANFEAWDAEKQKYELKQVYTGAFAYVLKPEARGSEPPHWLCTACYQNNKKSVLQAHRRDLTKRNEIYKCPDCNSTIRVHYNVHPGNT